MTESRPANVVVIMTDQHRADVCAREGFGLDTTPHLDSLAQTGAWFDRAYTTSPLCCPARTSLLTGRFPSAHRVTTNPAVDLAVFDDHLFGTARLAGCATALIGKNHTWLRAADLDHWVEFSHDGQLTGPRTDAERDFDDWLAGLRHHTPRAATPFDVAVQNPVRIVSHAQDWITSLHGDPFVLWLSFPEPHNPYQVPEPYFSMFDDPPPVDTGLDALDGAPFAWQHLLRIGRGGETDYDALVPRARASYFGMLRLIDDQIARFTAFLSDRGLMDDTLLVITSDHGDFVGEYGLVRKGAELPEVLTRVPFVVRGPGVVAGAGPRPEHVSLADVYPTVCEALGAAIPDGVQGRSLWPMLTGAPFPAEEFATAYVEQGMGGLTYQPSDLADDVPGLIDDAAPSPARFDELNAVTQSGRRRMLRRGRWKVVADAETGVRLFDLDADPRELHDRSGDPDLAAVLAGLLADLAAWMMRAEDPLPRPPTGYRVVDAPHHYRRR